MAFRLSPKPGALMAATWPLQSFPSSSQLSVHVLDALRPPLSLLTMSIERASRNRSSQHLWRNDFLSRKCVWKHVGKKSRWTTLARVEEFANASVASPSTSSATISKGFWTLATWREETLFMANFLTLIYTCSSVVFTFMRNSLSFHFFQIMYSGLWWIVESCFLSEAAFGVCKPDVPLLCPAWPAPRQEEPPANKQIRKPCQFDGTQKARIGDSGGNDQSQGPVWLLFMSNGVFLEWVKKGTQKNLLVLFWPMAIYLVVISTNYFSQRPTAWTEEIFLSKISTSGFWKCKHSLALRTMTRTTCTTGLPSFFIVCETWPCLHLSFLCLVQTNVAK